MAAVLAAAVGGGLKAYGVDVPHMNKVARQAMVAVVGVALIGLGIYAAKSPVPISSGDPAGAAEEGAAANSGAGVEMNSGAGVEVDIARPAAAPAASESRGELRERINRLTDAQALTMAAMMEPHIRDRPPSLGTSLQAMDPAGARLRRADIARDFLAYWLMQEGAPAELGQWKATLEVVERM